MIRTVLEAHAAACREAAEAARERPRWAGGSLAGAGLWGARLSCANLAGADLTGARLARADLSGADLTGTNLTEATLVGADLRGADLRGADLAVTLLRNARLTGADLTGAHLTEGVACGRAIGGESGGCRWWAVALDGGGVVLECNGEAGSLNWWLVWGRQHYSPERWEEGPAVAIADAQALAGGVTDSPPPA